MLLDSIGHPLEFMAEGSELQIVDAAGHFLHLERPEVVNLRILDFLKQ
jgi:pimeloyl-ACP methyl ester carboxylesterase